MIVSCGTPNSVSWGKCLDFARRSVPLVVGICELKCCRRSFVADSDSVIISFTHESVNNEDRTVLVDDVQLIKGALAVM